jgi:hypothetical protein
MKSSWNGIEFQIPEGSIADEVRETFVRRNSLLQLECNEARPCSDDSQSKAMVQAVRVRLCKVSQTRCASR